MRSRSRTFFRSTFSIDDSPLGEVVGSEFDGHTIPGHDSDKVFSHLASDMGEHTMTFGFFQLDEELGVGESLDHSTFDTKRFFFGHVVLPIDSKAPTPGWKAGPLTEAGLDGEDDLDCSYLNLCVD